MVTDGDGLTSDYAYRKGEKVKILLVSIGDGHRLEASAAAAFLLMRDAAASDGIMLKVNSSFRTMGEQSRLRVRHDLEMREWMAGKRAKQPALVARPGYSTHQSGLSVDINRAHDDKTNNGIADGVTDKWLQANAARFGFVNDVRSEPWHYTYLPERASV